MFWRLYIMFSCGAMQLISGIIVKDPEPIDEYNYSFVINDPWTGDSKSHHETRRGAVVTGAYSVLDPDGTRRTVKYVADPTHGFKAVLVQEPVALPSTLTSQGKLYSDGDLSHSNTHLFKILNSPKSNKFFTPSYELIPENSPSHKLFFEPNERIKL